MRSSAVVGGAMARSLCVIALLSAGLRVNEARVTAEQCQVKPAERHCVIEHVSIRRWPHTVRYTFDWRTQRCYRMHWSNYCPIPTVETNNFATEEACIDACSGWA